VPRVTNDMDAGNEKSNRDNVEGDKKKWKLSLMREMRIREILHRLMEQRMEKTSGEENAYVKVEELCISKDQGEVEITTAFS